MIIAYGKIGRAWKLDPTRGTSTGGDADVARALHILARERPHDMFVLVGRNSGEDPASVGYPSNVLNPWAGDFGKLFKKTFTAIIKEGKSKDTTGAFTETTMANALAYMDHIAREMFIPADEVIMWAGQHGTSNAMLPQIEDRSQLTKPQDSFVQYASYLLMGINHFRAAHPGKDAIWLCPDPRNYLKMRDLKDPLLEPVIAQFAQKRPLKHERYDDPTEPTPPIKWDTQGGVWVAEQRYSYGALELTALPSPSHAEMSDSFSPRYDFGMLVNENRAYVARDRLSVLSEWVLPNWPACEIFGKWTAASMKKLGREDIRVAPYEHVPTVIKRWRTTLTTPASGSGWATAKPWECFAYGTVCFFHPDYDSQGWILPTVDQLMDGTGDLHEGADLARWLRVQSPEQLKARVDYLAQNEDVWRALVVAQRAYFEQAYDRNLGGTRMILERLEK